VSGTTVGAADSDAELGEHALERQGFGSLLESLRQCHGAAVDRDGRPILAAIAARADSAPNSERSHGDYIDRAAANLGSEKSRVARGANPF
jgi:hypothetical protein